MAENENGFVPDDDLPAGFDPERLGADDYDETDGE